MRSSFAILILALLPLASVAVQADDGTFNDGTFFRASAQGPCRTKHGIATTEDFYCTKSAPHPKQGIGSFAPCSEEAAVTMLDGDDSPIHFLANGKVMVEDVKPKVIDVKKNGFETFTIIHPGNNHMYETQRVVTIRRDQTGNIAQIKSVAYTGKVDGPGLDKANAITFMTNYSYPAPKFNCQVDRIETDLLATNSSPKTNVAYDGELCSTVLGIVGQRKPADIMARVDLVKRIQGAVQDRTVELLNNESKGLMYDGTKSQTSVLVQACRNGGTPVDLSRKLGSPATGMSGQ